MPNQTPRARIGEHAIDLGRRRPGIDGHGNHAQPAAGIDQLEVLGLVGEKDGEPVARAEPLPVERRGKSTDTIVKLSKARRLAIGTKNGWMLRTISSRSAERVHMHHGRNSVGRWCFARKAANAPLASSERTRAPNSRFSAFMAAFICSRKGRFMSLLLARRAAGGFAANLRAVSVAVASKS